MAVGLLDRCRNWLKGLQCSSKRLILYIFEMPFPAMIPLLALYKIKSLNFLPQIKGYPAIFKDALSQCMEIRKQGGRWIYWMCSCQSNFRLSSCKRKKPTTQLLVALPMHLCWQIKIDWFTLPLKYSISSHNEQQKLSYH